jgi:hypothetical protein
LQTDQPKGFGYIEFETRANLVGALDMDGSEFKGRELRVNLAETRQDDRPRGFAGGYEPDVMDWRTSKAPEIAPRERDRGGFGDRGDRDRDSDRRRGGDRDRDADRRRGGFGDRDRDRGDDTDRRSSRRNDDDDAADRFGFGRGDRAERPRLNLAPRAAGAGGGASSAGASPAASPSAAAASGKSNPFGAARPRDENEILRKKEEERKARQAADRERRDKERGTDSADSGKGRDRREPAAGGDRKPQGTRPLAGKAAPDGEQKIANKFDALKIEGDDA